MYALIAARGGSKRLPGKNIRPLAGKPLIHHTLEVALQAKGIDRVFVSTDCPDIRKIAMEIQGVEAPFLRPAEFASDVSQAYDVHMHFVSWLKEHENVDLKHLCLLLATSPLRLVDDVNQAIDLFYETKAHVVTSVYQTKPLGWHLKMDAQSKRMTPLINMDPKEAVKNYQDLEAPPYILNGSIYVLDIEVYRNSRTYFGDKTYGYEMPLSRSMDIDTIDDFNLAEAIFKARSNT